MGVYIKGMEMPISCYYCPMTNDGFYLCKATSQYKELENDCEERRPDWCPLIEVPEPHGKLKDADALHSVLRLRGKEFSDSEYGEGVKCGLADAREYIKIAPTIIPASGGTDNE